MTESLWNKYDISRKSPEVPVKRSPKVARKERALALNAPWDSTAIGWKYTSWWGSYISSLYDKIRTAYIAPMYGTSRSKKTNSRKRNVSTSKLRFPGHHHLRSEFLVERTGVRQKASGKEDITDQSTRLRLETLAGFGPANALTRQTVDEGCSVVHLASTCVRVVHQRLQCGASHHATIEGLYFDTLQSVSQN